MTSMVKNTMQRYAKITTLILGVGLAAGSLSGCGSSSISSLGAALTGGSSSSGGSGNNTQQQTPPVKQVSATQTTPTTFSLKFGHSLKVANQLSKALQSEGQQRNIIIQNGGGSTDYKLVGYVSALAHRNGTKLTYIWDVQNPNGKRAHRINGSTVIPDKANAKDPWANISQGSLNAVAANITTQLANWRSGGQTPSGLVRQASLKNTGSVKSGASGPVVAIVPQVKGAPGDGNRSLASALREQLQARGVKIAPLGSSSGKYKVQGLVRLTSAGSGQQRVAIDWQVSGPGNSNLGKVSQKNTIPAGSLDGNWGPTAKAAASAAAKGIANLLMEKSKSGL